MLCILTIGALKVDITSIWLLHPLHPLISIHQNVNRTLCKISRMSYTNDFTLSGNFQDVCGYKVGNLAPISTCMAVLQGVVRYSYIGN